MVTASPVQVPDKIAREVRIILVLTALSGLAIVGVLALAGGYLYRVNRYERRLMASIEEVAEGLERRQLREAALSHLLAGEFEEIDRQARAMRACRDVYVNGAWRLTALYDAFGPGQASSFDWEAALGRAQEWTERHPDSLTARLALAELWMAYAWEVRAGKWEKQLTADDRELFAERLSRAEAALAAAEAIDEYCPHEAASRLRLAVSRRETKQVEAAIFEEAVRAEPDYQPYYGLHLFYLEPSWEGGPGDWQRAAAAIAAQPGGPERYARSVWYRSVRTGDGLGPVSWPLLRQGFQEMGKRYPDSFEVKSAFCFFAVRFKDLPETQRLLREIGPRMQTSVWRDRNQFAEAHRWANFDNGEEGPAALRWLMRLRAP